MNQARVKMSSIWGTRQEILGRFWNEAKETYKELVQDNIHIEKYVSFVHTNLSVLLLPYGELYCLYPEQTGQDMLRAIIYEHFAEMIDDAFVQDLMLQKEWTNSADIGDIQTEATSTNKYSGFSIQNQSGNFTSTVNSGKSKGSTNKLNFINYVRTYSTRKAAELARKIKANLMQIVY